MATQHKSRGPLVGVILAVLVLVPVVYFFSIGPVIYFSNDARTINNYCYPLNVAITYFPPLSKPAKWYAGLFVSDEEG